MLRGTPIGRATLAALVLYLAGAARAHAQSGVADVERRGLIHGGARPPRGFYEMVARRPGAFEFKHGWLERARAVRQNRQALRSRGAFALLNAGTAGGAIQSATVVSGTLRLPTFLPLFLNTTAADSQLQDSANVADRFWSTAPAPPYSVTTYYKEISNNNLTVTGGVIQPIRVSQTDTFYSSGPTCQGIFCAVSHVPDLIAELILHADSTVDFSQFVDTATGYVPAIVILDPQVGGECLGVYSPASNSIWSHRYSYSGWTNVPITTNDPWPGHPGQFVKIDDYIIQGGQGQGPDGPPYGPECAPGYLAPIGTVTHETGHLFGLPDLYDTGPQQTEGVGRWDLMASGNEKLPYRPAHMSAWSLSFLGWITEIPIATAQTDTVGPIEQSNTAYIVPIAGTPHNEYFLLENRQRIGSDSMMYGPGLMIYHVDTVLMAQRMFGNSVNASFPHALAVVEADGDNSLNKTFGQLGWNRGDTGDPFPGTSNNTALGVGTNPAATKNSGSPAPVIIDSIAQISPFGPIRFRVRLGYLVTVAKAGTGSVSATRTIDPVDGAMLAVGDSMTLTPVPGAGQSFLGWTGDTTSRTPALKLRGTRPYAITANFVATADVVNQILTGAGAITPSVLQTLDLLGNNNGKFDLGDFVAWLDRNPDIVSAAVVARLLGKVAR